MFIWLSICLKIEACKFQYSRKPHQQTQMRNINNPKDKEIETFERVILLFKMDESYYCLTRFCRKNLSGSLLDENNQKF